MEKRNVINTTSKDVLNKIIIPREICIKNKNLHGVN